MEVRLWHGAKSVRLIALVDSGADASLLNIQYGDLLDLDKGAAQSVPSIVASGEEIATYRWPGLLLELQFEQERFPFEGSFVDFGAGDGENLVGRRDFFQRFVIQFWDTAELMNIDLSPDYPRSVP